MENEVSIREYKVNRACEKYESDLKRIQIQSKIKENKALESFIDSMEDIYKPNHTSIPSISEQKQTTKQLKQPSLKGPIN